LQNIEIKDNIESESTADINSNNKQKTRRNISSITGTARKVGNGAHIMVPREWIGKQCHVIPVEIFNEEMLDQMLKGHRFGVRYGRRRRK
jgi:putative transposon-encoded protein